MKKKRILLYVLFIFILTITTYGFPFFASKIGISTTVWAKSKKIKTIKTKKIHLSVGQSKKLKASKLKKKVKWKSSNRKVVSVNKKGKIKAKAPGFAKITASSGKKRYIFKVTVKESSNLESEKKQNPSGQDEKKEQDNDDGGGSADEDPLEVHFIDVGQGDAILLRCRGQAMMVDFGDNSKGTYLQNYLKKQGINSLEYAVGTHPDEDHIGGMDVILYKFSVKHVLMPDITNDTATYRDVVDTCKGKGYKIEHPTAGSSFALGAAKVIVLAPVNSKYDNLNAYSIVLKVVIGKDAFLLTGDATEKSESEMITTGRNLSADVLKVGHHGSYSSTSDEFLKKVSPKFAVISCGEGNSYGHPHKVVMDRLKKSGIKILRTDKQGTIVAQTAGHGIAWSSSPTTDYSGTSSYQTPDNESLSDTTDITEAPVKAGSVYILNTNTMKYHLPGCSAADKISEKNRKESTETAESLQASGYSPCGICIGK